MKERNILYFITAVLASILFLMSIIIRFFPAYRFQAFEYADVILLDYYYFIVPVLLLWLGWYFEDELFIVLSSTVFVVFFVLHLENFGVLSNSPYIISTYAPTVKTVYMLGLLLMAGTIVTGFFEPIKKHFCSLKTPTK